MFRGSPGLTADQLANIGSVMGGNFNANTRESRHPISLHRSVGRPRRRAAHRSAAHAERCSARRGLGQGTRRDRAGSRAGSLQPVLHRSIKSCVRSLFAGTPYEHAALGTRPVFDKTTARDASSSFHDDLVRAEQRHSGDRRRRRSERHAGEGAKRCSAASSRKTLAGATAFRLSRRPKPIVQSRYRPAQRNGHRRHAHARYSTAGFPGA